MSKFVAFLISNSGHPGFNSALDPK